MPDLVAQRSTSLNRNEKHKLRVQLLRIDKVFNIFSSATNQRRGELLEVEPQRACLKVLYNMDCGGKQKPRNAAV